MIAALAYRRSVIDKERELAAKVSSWLTIADNEVWLAVRNAGHTAVYDVIVRLANRADHVEPASVSSGCTRRAIIPSSVTERTESRMRYRDVVGRYWSRDFDGTLELLGGPRLSFPQAKQAWRARRRRLRQRLAGCEPKAVVRNASS